MCISDRDKTQADRSAVSANVDLEHFTFKESTTVEIEPDGSSVITVKYSRKTYTITFHGEQAKILTCGEEAHEHSIWNGCYKWNGWRFVLDCDKRPHTHGNGCYSSGTTLYLTAKYQQDIGAKWLELVGPDTIYAGRSWRWDDSYYTDVYKRQGKVTVSLSMSACYFVLTETEIGEICFLVFNHLFLFKEDLICRMACAATVSSGGNKRPTMHRLLLSRAELDVDHPDSEDFKFLRGQLMLNTSDILIEKRAYDKFKKEEQDFVEKNEIRELLDELEGGTWESLQVYRIDEAKIRNADCRQEEKIRLISLLRNYSMNEKYNKISTKTDEHICNYIENKIYYKNTDT